jgi:hypothetical protein
MLKRDLTALFGVRNINDLEKLFIYLCLHSGGILAQPGLRPRSEHHHLSRSVKFHI